MDEQTLPEPEPGFNLGVSVSGSPDLARLGLTETHLNMALGEVARAVLIANGRLTYGGHLDSTGYTAFLIHECEKHSARNRPFTGCVPLSVHASLSDEEIEQHRRRMGLFGRYMYLDADGDVIDRPGASGVIEDLDLDQETTVRALTGLRRYMTVKTDGRVVLGGVRTDYEGSMPGVVEETIMSIRAGKPVFVAGGFGGAAADIATVLGLDPERWLGLSDRSTDTDMIELRAAVDDVGWDATSNGLTPDQNQRLAISYRASDVASLVVLGLSNLRERGE